MNNIKVSIIVPVYNAEKYIDRCLNSLVNQTLKEIEIIIVNDNTPDNSMKICEEYANKDDRIKIYNKKNNEGQGIARNYGISKANGEYIGFVDADDYIDKEYYEKMYNKIVETNTDICFAEYIRFKNSEGSEYTKYQIPFENDTESTKNVLYNIFLNITNPNKNSICSAIWQAIFKKSIIKENSIIFVSREYFAEDTIFLFDFLMNSKMVCFVKNTYYYYYYNEQSTIHIYVENKLDKVKLLKDKLTEQAVNYGVLENVYNGIINIFIGFVKTIIRQEINNKNKLRNKINNIKKIVNDKEVIEALKDKKEEQFRKKVFNFLMKKKQVILLIIMLKITK